jgi:hypothetical protein
LLVTIKKGGLCYAYFTSRNTKRKNCRTEARNGEESHRCGYRNFDCLKEAISIIIREMEWENYAKAGVLKVDT